VLLAAERTKQILKGEPVLIEDYRDNKEVVTALREIAAGKVLPDLTDFNENANVDTAAGPAVIPQPTDVDEELPPEADE
jgi:DNA-directed RNA polymerase subunit K/omega